MSTLRRFVTAVIAVTAVAALACGCGGSVNGQASSPLYDPLRVAGVEAVDGPSGVRDGAASPTGDVEGTDGGEIDRLATLGVNDVTEYWEENYDQFLDGRFRSVENLLSYDSDDPASPRVCGAPTFDSPNAFFCPKLWLMAWDRAFMVPVTKKYFGDATVAGLIAHEYGHAVQNMADLVNILTDVIVREQQADCFAGNYMRWVTDGHSPRFSLSTGDGLTHVLAGLIASRDPIITPETDQLIEEGHGTALDRVSAFQIGYMDGPGACAAIDMDEIESRRGDLPLVLQNDSLGDQQSGEVPIDRDVITTLVDQLGRIFPLDNKPTLSFDNDSDCGGSAAKYCSDTNTIAVDLDELSKLAEPKDESEGALIQGDDTALSIVMSRYALAVQHERSVSLNTPYASLRTACLTGVAHRHMLESDGDNPGLVLTAGDVDEAVAGLLTNGQAAADEDGNAAPAGFSRIVAFRSGLANEQDLCFERYSSEEENA
ncbi:peptidase [Mycobacterium sp. NPDC003449]